eukprot:TRINITY_DN7011_c0_g1_i2.p1 TRINITY_DN7011_c0_g1~~TRINITY_DN7011_c0_g1_i2.p1  ORF type:complete len:282 (-),score=75.73 TRINITY_DN7011_c0_g1_i2:177-1022(-)
MDEEPKQLLTSSDTPWFSGQEPASLIQLPRMEDTPNQQPPTSQDQLKTRYARMFNRMVGGVCGADEEDEDWDRFNNLFEILNVSNSGVLTEEEMAAADLDDAKPFFQKLFMDAGGYGDREHALLEAGVPPVVGMNPEQFCQHLQKMRTLTNNVNTELFGFLLTYLEKQVPRSVGEYFMNERAKLDPGSDKFNVRVHLENVKTKALGAQQALTLCLKDAGFVTVKRVFEEPTVWRFIKKIACGCCNNVKDKLQDSQVEKYHIFQNLDAVCRAGEMTLSLIHI